jgi:DNA polymerase I-like protein with 3'-5' exonuclease and polymerase domains
MKFVKQHEWVMPENIPDAVFESDIIAIDLETKDPNLKKIGAGWSRNDGHTIGVAIAVEGWKGYYPIKHEIGPNFDEKVLKRILKKLLATDATKVFHNAIYDIGWLSHMGLTVHGEIRDTMLMGALVDENRLSYSLNNLSKDYLDDKKSESGLYKAAEEFNADAKAEMYKLPAMDVGPYAEQDTVLTHKLYHKFLSIIEQEELNEVYQLEMNLLPTIFEMQKKGVRIDLDQAEKSEKDLLRREKKILDHILKDTGVAIDPFNARAIGKAFDAKKIKYERTEISGQPKFDKDFLSNHPSDLAQNVVQLREINKARTTFIETLKKHSYKGRIHASINQLRNDMGGTVSGRVSMKNPNLQQMPARNPEVANIIRSLFLPEEGEKWGAFDYSQQEPRIMTHFASSVKRNGNHLYGIMDVVEAFKDPSTDFHQQIADMAEIPRKQAKTINLGLSYGMGIKKLSGELKMELNDAKVLFNKYHARVPFVKELIDIATQRAEKYGFIRTIMGRKCRFNLYVPTEWGVFRPLPKEEAEQQYGTGFNQIKRAGTFRALNRLIQGSAADQTKKSMVDLASEGLLPLIQIHDELDFSVGSEEEQKKIIEIMENSVNLNVPSKVDLSLGNNWGEAND